MLSSDLAAGIAASVRASPVIAWLVIALLGQAGAIIYLGVLTPHHSSMPASYYTPIAVEHCYVGANGQLYALRSAPYPLPNQLLNHQSNQHNQ